MNYGSDKRNGVLLTRIKPQWLKTRAEKKIKAFQYTDSFTWGSFLAFLSSATGRFGMKTRRLVEKQACRDMRKATWTDAGVMLWFRRGKFRWRSALNIRMSAHFLFINNVSGYNSALSPFGVSGAIDILGASWLGSETKCTFLFQLEKPWPGLLFQVQTSLRIILSRQVHYEWWLSSIVCISCREDTESTVGWQQNFFCSTGLPAALYKLRSLVIRARKNMFSKFTGFSFRLRGYRWGLGEA